MKKILSLMLFVSTVLAGNIFAGSQIYTGTSSSSCIAVLVPSGSTELTFQLENLSGNVDIYYYDTLNSCISTLPGTYECSPQLSGTNTETCGPYAVPGICAASTYTYYAYINEVTGPSDWTLNVTWVDPVVPTSPDAGMDVTIVPGEDTTLMGSVLAPIISDTLLLEDFSGGDPGWLNVQSTGVTTVWTHSTTTFPAPTATPNTTTAGNGYMIADSEQNGSSTAGNTRLTILPGFDFTNFTSVNFAMSHYYRDIGSGDNAKLQIRINGGTWTNLTIFNGGGGTANAENYSISIPAAAGQSNVRFRFRYQQDQDYYWFIDDILVYGDRPADMTYSWSPGLSLNDSTVASPVASPTSTTTYTMTATAAGCSVSDDVTVFVGNPLPVQLINFTAKAVGNEFIQLNWETATEINNEGFEIQRSLDGRDFKKIDFIAGNGNSSNLNGYNFVDHDLEQSIVYYYRLKQIDFDGEYEYLPIRSASLSDVDNFSQLDVTIYPNPASKSFILDTEKDINNIKIINILGEIVISKKVSENSNLKFDVSDQETGIYFLHIYLKDESRPGVKKIIIK